MSTIVYDKLSTLVGLLMNIQTYLGECKKKIDIALDLKLPSATTSPHNLHKAMRYSVLNGGKRLRSALLYAVGEALNADESVLTSLCMAVEMIHAFSLIHDDLPALDNDNLRRGVPTCHIAFGEATAILAGDVLQSFAFEIIAEIDEHKLNPEIKIEMIRLLARAIGSHGMIGGEELDIEMVNKNIPVHEIEEMYKLKTGCLIGASVMLGALASNCDNVSLLNNLKKFGEHIGISFQIHDDIIGIESDTKTLGKKQNADLDLNKPTYPNLVGIDSAKERRDKVYDIALSYLKKSNISHERLEAISAYLIQRNY